MDTRNLYMSTPYFDNISSATIGQSYHTVPIYVLVFSLTSCSLSLFGILCIFVSYFAIKSIQNYIRKLLLCLTLSNLIDVLGIVLGLVRYMLLEFTDERYKQQKQTCVFQSIVTSFAPCTSFFWTVIIAVYFQVQVLKPSWAHKMSTKCATMTYHILSWGVPGFICVLALYFDVFGDTEAIYTGPWCWIKTNPRNRKSAILWMIVTVKGWELLSYLILAEVLVFVVYKTYILPRCLRRRGRPYTEIYDQSANVSSRLRKEDKNFVFVWLIFYALRFAGTFRFVAHVIYGPINLENNTSLRITDRVMLAWQAFGDTAQAFVNFIFLCVFDKVIRKHYCSCLTRNTGNNHVTGEETEQKTGINT